MVQSLTLTTTAAFDTDGCKQAAALSNTELTRERIETLRPPQRSHLLFSLLQRTWCRPHRGCEPRTALPEMITSGLSWNRRASLIKRRRVLCPQGRKVLDTSALVPMLVRSTPPSSCDVVNSSASWSSIQAAMHPRDRRRHWFRDQGLIIHDNSRVALRGIRQYRSS